ncbi:MAG: PH domain-containing protein [Candidatus Aenigmarchaeota archaeon]|nr:PH domain-containing protein [Candidatus Aenigmarchaeota archaeon]
MVNWHLLPNEKKIHQASVSRKLFYSYYFVVALFFVAAVGINFIDYPLPKMESSIALLAGGFIALFAVERKRSMEVMLITDERVLILRQPDGVRGPMTMESIPFDKLSNVQVVQTRKQRILGTGDVVFRLPGEEHTVTDIAHPYEIERAIYRILDIEKRAGVRQV